MNTLGIEALVAYMKGLIQNLKGKPLFDTYFEKIEACTPIEIIDAIDRLILEKADMEALKLAISKTLNVLHNNLSQLERPKIPKESMLYYLVENNKIMDRKLKELRSDIKTLNNYEENLDLRKSILAKIQDISRFEKHYIIKENILFPLIEKELPNYRCLQVMWSIEDDIRKTWKQLTDLLNSGDFEISTFNEYVGNLYFDMYAIKFREEKILFPVILERIAPSKFEGLLEEAMELGFPYIQPDLKIESSTVSTLTQELVNLPTGNLNLKELELIFNTLPVDLTFVDADDTVRFFSSPEKRIFPRSKAIIGRKVQNCHPPESIDIVNKILEAFKKGEKTKAEFWIQLKGQFVLIQYYALFDENKKYTGTLEVSMEITDIKKLEGEKRLLDWE